MALVERVRADRSVRRVGELARSEGLSTRSLQRLFAAYVGVGPKWVVLRYRIHEALERAESTATVDWSALAATLGYADQAHLVRDFTAKVRSRRRLTPVSARGEVVRLAGVVGAAPYGAGMELSTRPTVRLRSWSENDLWLLWRQNASEMTRHLGGPESEAKLIDRHHRYLQPGQRDRMFRIVVDGGSVGPAGQASNSYGEGSRREGQASGSDGEVSGSGDRVSGSYGEVSDSYGERAGRYEECSGSCGEPAGTYGAGAGTHGGAAGTYGEAAGSDRRAAAHGSDGRVAASDSDAREVTTGSIGYWEQPWHDGTVWETGWAVLPEFQRRGLAVAAALLVCERARAERRHRFVHAFPSVVNASSNAVCRKAGFELLGDVDLEYPKGHWSPHNDWRFDLGLPDLPGTPGTPAAS